MSAILLLALVPGLASQHLPLKFDWLTLSIAYWLILAAQSVFLAAILCLIGSARERQALRERFQEKPLLLLPPLLFFAILACTTTWLKGLVITGDAVALLELIRRQKPNLHRAFAAVFAPAAYLFFGFLMVLAYNYAIVSARNNFSTDPALAAIDRVLLAGHSVSELSHGALQVLPLWSFRVFEFIYFGMFPQIGAALILVSLAEGKTRGFEFIGTILTSYYLALIIFFLWPAQGPYTLCPGHFARFPASLQSYIIQRTLILHAVSLFEHVPIPRISTDYFIAFPCMHIVQPLIVIWFLRRSRLIMLALGVYDCFLVASILLLEMHYVIDILVGILVAATAIAISGGPLRLANHPEPALPGTRP
jgi:PAP2 superfamily